MMYETEWWQHVLRVAIQFGVPFLFIFVFVVAVMLPLMIYMERKVCAYIQDRRGPNRASVFGIRAFGVVNLFADVLKLLFKEDVEPKSAKLFMFRLAPLIVMASVLVVMSAVPFGEPITFGASSPEWLRALHPAGTWSIHLQMVNLNAALLFVFAIASLEVYGVILGGWSSANKYSFLGAVRGTAQMISYEVTMGLAVLGVLIVYGTADLQHIVLAQGANPFGSAIPGSDLYLPGWGIWVSALGFVLFLTAIFAETNRNPFDLPEAESEVVAGYHLEYSSFKFALYFMGEYVSMVVSAALIVTLFLGGWHVPFVTSQMLVDNAPLVLQILFGLGAVALAVFGAAAANAAMKPRRIFGDRRDNEPKIFAGLFFVGAVVMVALLVLMGSIELAGWMRTGTRALVQAAAFCGKTFVMSFFFIWVRWTLPRLRYDQLMAVGWRWMLPIGLVNVLLTYAFGVWFLDWFWAWVRGIHVIAS